MATAQMRASAPNGGLRRTAAVRSQLNFLRVRELHVVLGDLNLPRSGRKQELIDRIAHALEQFELKAGESGGNQAMCTHYNNQLAVGLRSIDTQLRLSRPNHPGVSAHSAAAPSSSASSYSGTTTPPSRYAQPPTAQPAPYHPRASSSASYNSSGLLPTPLPLGFECLQPRLIDGVRCFCGAPSGKTVHCVGCDLRAHAKCHQLIAAPAEDEWYCERCRASVFDPFLRVHKTVLAPQFVRFNRSLATYRIEYAISDGDLNDLYARRETKAGAMTPGCRELQLRCFVLNEELATGTSWPATSQVSVNGFNLQLVQRAPPGQSNPSKVLRELPANVFPFSRVGRNVVEVRTNESPSVFVFLVQVVEFRDIQELVAEVTAASAQMSYEQAREQVIKSFGDDDDVVTTCTVLSVRCPLGLCVISLPARGLHCKHLQCFDLRTFLQFNKKARSRAYRCTVCHNFIKATDLRIDPYLKKLLAEVADDDELEEVEISPDATWKRRTADDATAAPPQKRIKQEASSESASGASDTTGNATTNGSAPVEIVLLSSDDEDEDDDESSSSTAPSRSTTATAETTTPVALYPSSDQRTSALSDDDVAILTVDSDIWETSPAGTAASTQALAGFSAAQANGLMPFPLDDALFAGLTAADPTVAAAWNPASAPYFGASNPYAVPGSAAPWNSSLESSRSATEADLATAMALLSESSSSSRPSAAATHSAPAAPATGAAKPSPPPPPSSRGVLDVICLLDSDSE
ncbi:hypothetical protein ATCC90586_009094 [Pythium insidiosum]|nr:hypothetical protein ATCC90586_009094 [Pythium insidiosum]